MRLPFFFRSPVSSGITHWFSRRLRRQAGSQLPPTGQLDFQALRPEQWELYRAHIFRLDPGTRRCRFGMEADDAFLDQYLRKTPHLGTTLFVCLENGVIRASAELRPVDRKTVAEATICVEDGWRRRGIGTSLMRRVLTAAEAANVSEIYIGCQTSNRAMRRLAAKFAADIAVQHGTLIGRFTAGDHVAA